MIDGASVLAIFLMVIACLLGLRWTRPVPPVRPVVQEPEPRQVVSVVRPMAIAEPEPAVVPVCVPVVHASTDETVKLPAPVLSFLEGL